MQISGPELKTKIVTLLCVAVWLTGLATVRAAEPVVNQVFYEKPTNEMLRYFQRLAKDRPLGRSAPKSVQEWEERRAKIRGSVRQSMGDFPFDARPPLNPKITGTIDGGDIIIEKVLYESLPGLYVTALLYRPKEIAGPLPAVLCLNGHWPEAKFTDHIQMRCQSLAKMGVIAFCQDVIGTGERSAAAGSPHVTYHGNYRGGVAQITGHSLFGYEMFEGIRALDYLTSRTDIDPKRIICTGASGGGMQSMYLPALDDRLAGAVPVCYISSYYQHIGATACVGEVVRGVLNYTDQWELLGMHAPRPLLCIAASKDVSWFQPAHAIDAIRRTRREIYDLYDEETFVSVVTVEAPHAYNKEMRELLYNFVAVHLQGIEKPALKEPENLVVRTRAELTVGLPASSETIASLTYKAAQVAVAAMSEPRNPRELEEARVRIREKLHEALFTNEPNWSEIGQTEWPKIRTIDFDDYYVEHWRFDTEPGAIVPGALCVPRLPTSPRPAVVVFDDQGKKNAFGRGLVNELVNAGNVVLAIDCRGTGETAGTVPSYDTEGLGTDDYNLANYSLLVGRPFIGMQSRDIRRAVEFLRRHPAVDANRISVVGRGRVAFSGLISAIFDPQIQSVAMEEMLASYIYPGEFKGIGLSYLIPGILKGGDIEHYVACVLPRRLMIINPVNARREALSDEQLVSSFAFARKGAAVIGGTEKLVIENCPADKTALRLAEWLQPAK